MTMTAIEIYEAAKTVTRTEGDIAEDWRNDLHFRYVASAEYPMWHVIGFNNDDEECFYAEHGSKASALREAKLIINTIP